MSENASEMEPYDNYEEERRAIGLLMQSEVLKLFEQEKVPAGAAVVALMSALFASLGQLPTGQMIELGRRMSREWADMINSRGKG